MKHQSIYYFARTQCNDHSALPEALRERLCLYLSSCLGEALSSEGEIPAGSAEHAASQMAAFIKARMDEGVRLEDLLHGITEYLTEAEPEFAQDAAEDQMDDRAAIKVMVCCEAGILLIREAGEKNREGMTADVELHRGLRPLTEYLLSFSKFRHNGIRLSLIRYFGHLSLSGADSLLLSQLMARHGYPTLHLLLSSLDLEADQRSAYAFSFLMENLPCYFMADDSCQRIIHEVLNSYMLRTPDILPLFLKKFARSGVFKGSGLPPRIREVFCLHIGGLLRTAAELGRISMVWDLFCALEECGDMELRNQYITALSERAHNPPVLRDFLSRLSGVSCRARHGRGIALIRASLRQRQAKRTIPSLVPAKDATPAMMMMAFGLPAEG